MLHPDTEVAIRLGGRPGTEEWLAELPTLVGHYASWWGLRTLEPFSEGRSSCCVACERADGGTAVLKIAPPWHGVERETAALAAWEGVAAPQLLAKDLPGRALLMERILPGTPLPGDTPIEQVAELLDRTHVEPTGGREIPALGTELLRRLEMRLRESLMRQTLRTRPRKSKPWLIGMLSITHGDCATG